MVSIMPKQILNKQLVSGYKLPTWCSVTYDNNSKSRRLTSVICEDVGHCVYYCFFSEKSELHWHLSPPEQKAIKNEFGRKTLISREKFITKYARTVGDSAAKSIYDHFSKKHKTTDCFSYIIFNNNYNTLNEMLDLIKSFQLQGIYGAGFPSDVDSNVVCTPEGEVFFVEKDYQFNYVPKNINDKHNFTAYCDALDRWESQVADPPPLHVADLKTSHTSTAGNSSCLFSAGISNVGSRLGLDPKSIYYTLMCLGC